MLLCAIWTLSKLSDFQASLDSCFSPVCHRTRQQTRERLVSDSAHGSSVDQVVSDTICELVDEVSCTTPLIITRDVAQVFSPSNIIDIEDVPRSSPNTIITIEDVQYCARSSGLCSDTVSDEIALFPSDLEVRDLFSDSYVSQKFDFVKLLSLQCRRQFFSAGGLENHLYAVHDIHLDTVDDLPTRGELSSTCVAPPEELLQFCPSTSPPSCAPFSTFVPAKTWASVASKPGISTSEPWAGRPIGASFLPRIAPKTLAKPLTQKITFSPEAPADHSYIASSSVRRPRRYKKINCGRCDFTFKTVKSRDEHHKVHDLEDAFNALHNISLSVGPSDFKVLLPKVSSSRLKGASTSVFSRSASKSSKQQVAQVNVCPSTLKSVNCAATVSAGSNGLSTQGPFGVSRSGLVPASSSAVVSDTPKLTCLFCEKSGFPSRKALKYHLFRVHGQPMRKASQQQYPSTSSQEQAAVSPVRSAHIASTVERLDAKISMSFPIHGKIVCPESGCAASFVSR
ncbi:hypothetical protein CDAR_495271 [Caerostris darwini]|uniref:C2H2-type domain-containing protein n=1 Tax=Caerostris darwini TaxID=1538125 RepID=A0AAV4UXQ4_9ARAC|nr:hypothetical protein CDAR_495271 [Caerostris darwini]